MVPAMKNAPELLTPGEVAELFGVGLSTIGRWADNGTLDFIRTPGGHRRFKRASVEARLAEAAA